MVAYTSSLSLTILLLSAPYFASYFINYYKKLHQIEEAILLLADNKGGDAPPSSAWTESTKNAYSAVSVQPMEDDQPADLIAGTANSQRSGESVTLLAMMHDPDPQPFSGSDAVMAPPSPPVETDRKRKNAPEATENQLSLFDANNEPAVQSDQADTSVQTSEKEKDEETLDCAPTVIHAYVLMDSGKTLYARTSSEVFGAKGERILTEIDVGKYELILRDVRNDFDLVFYLNNQTPHDGNPLPVRAGMQHEFYPEFAEA